MPRHSRPIPTLVRIGGPWPPAAGASPKVALTDTARAGEPSHRWIEKTNVVRPLRRSHPANALRWALNFRGQRSAIGRRYVFDALSRVTPSVAVDTDGLRLYVSTSDREVSRATFAGGAYERTLFSRVMDELRRVGMGAHLAGRGFLDVGANIGSATCLALRRYGAAEAWMFEPAPENLRLLRQNVLANGFEHQAHVHPIALSDDEGSVAFELSDLSWGDHRVRVERESNDGPPDLQGETQRATVEVRARRLDSLVDEGSIDLTSLGLAWIDVQGHEGHVLAGAAGLLASAVPIVCEYWPYGLERAGGLERFHTLVLGSRSGFIDLATPQARVLPTAGLRDLPTRYPGLTYTDLLLLP